MEEALTFANKAYINGEFVSTVEGKTFETFCPTTGDVLAVCADCTAADVDKAVNAAIACMNSSSWGYASSGADRAKVLTKLADIFREKKQDIATIDSTDQGKPMREALADVDDAIAACEHFASLAIKQDSDQDEKIDVGDEAFTTTVRHEPIGVVGAITPWNYPFLMGIWKVVPAIAAGCAVVLKPSELAPLSCLLMGKLCTDAGLPAGALNVVPGLGVTAGAAISEHPKIDKVSFTGSVPTARRVMAAAAMGPRGISLELGGKSPLIIFEDFSDINAAVDWVLTGVLWGSGQVCSSTSRVMIHESIEESFMTRLLERIALVKIWNTQSADALADQDCPQMGPVVSKPQYDKIWKFINEAKSQGIKCAYEGPDQSSMIASHGNGYFIPPYVFTDVPTTSRVWKEEIFGPVLCIRTFKTEDEALQCANDTQYGLAGAVFSNDKERCRRVSKALRCGIVWVNNCQPAFIQAPWGGVKQSGFGRELGRWGLEEFSSVKAIHTTEPGFSWGIW